MKFALIFEKSLQHSFSVRNNIAYRYNTDIEYNWHASIKNEHGMTTMGPFTYPFVFNGDYINWSEFDELPDNDYDVIFCAIENYPERYSVKMIRDRYPNAIIVGTIKELYFIKSYSERIKFFNECDFVCIPYKESFYTFYPDIQSHVLKPINWLPQGYDIDFLYKSFYREERTECIFSYVAPHPPRRANTERFANYLSTKYQIPVIRTDITTAYDKQWYDFTNNFSYSTFCINLDPEPQYGQQGIQSAILGVVNIGGVNDSHFNLWPNTANNDLDKLEYEFKNYIEDIDYRHQTMIYAFNKCKEIYSFDAVYNKFKLIIQNKI